MAPFPMLAQLVLAVLTMSMGMGQDFKPGNGPQVLVHVSVYQGNPFWVTFFDPAICPRKKTRFLLKDVMC